jgi:hypothetical protein
LWNKHKKTKKVYYDAIKECLEACDEFYKLAGFENPFYSNKYEDAYDATCKKDHITFRKLVEIEKAIL